MGASGLLNSKRAASARRFRAMCYGTTALMLCAGFSTAIAQERRDQRQDAVFSMEEIIVSAPQYVPSASRSALKDDAPLVEIPQSVTLISRDQIDLLNWSSLQDAMRYTAGVTGENFGPDDRYDWLTVRGFYPVQYIDGLQAPVGSVTNTGTDLYGSESVDVLKGPSSVLYGQTPPGGIVNMRSRRPQFEWGGEAEIQYGNYDHKQANGDITGPITENLAFRLTGLYRDRENQVDFATSERIYVAPALTAQLTPDTQLTFLAYYQKDDVDNETHGFLPAFGTLLPNPLGEIPPSFFPGEPGHNFFKREQWAVGYDFAHSFSDNLALQQNLKYFKADTESRIVYGNGLLDDDADGIPDDYRTLVRVDFPFNEVVKSLNVDTRLHWEVNTGALEHSLLVGFDYRDYDYQSEFGFGDAPPIDIFNPVYGANVPMPALIPFDDQEQKQKGIYIQDQIRIDRFVLTLSGRQDWVTSINFGDRVKDDKFTYRAGLNYVFEGGFAPYIQMAKSFQPVAGRDIYTGEAFVPTTGTQYEAGIKYDGSNLGPDLKVFASAAVFNLVQKNVLTPANDPLNPFADIQEGEVEVNGVELEGVLRYRERLSINASYTYTDSEVTESNDPAVLGSRLMAVPKHKASLLVDYTFQDGPLAGLGAGGGVRHISGIYGDEANLWRVGSVTLFDAIIHYDTAGWRLAINANNLFDKEYVQRCSSATNCFYGTKRQVVGSITRKF